MRATMFEFSRWDRFRTVNRHSYSNVFNIEGSTSFRDKQPDGEVYRIAMGDFAAGCVVQLGKSARRFSSMQIFWVDWAPIPVNIVG